MSELTIFSSLLGLDSSWEVSELDLALAENSVKIHVVHVGAALCPVCKLACPLHDHSDERVWRHLDLWQAKTFLHAAMPRTDCPKHGVLTVSVPCSETSPALRFTSPNENVE